MNWHLNERRLLFALILLCTVQVGLSQSMQDNNKPQKNGCSSVKIQATALPKSNQTVVETEDRQPHPYGGTFQIVSKKGDVKEIFTTDLLKLVEANRSETDEKVISLSERTRIRIPSRRALEAKDFKPYEFLYSFE